MSDLATSKVAAKRKARISDILDCAEKNFVEKGFHGAGISGIAQDCGISVGHLYHYFSRKDDLIRAVVERELDRQEARFEEFETLEPEHIRADAVEKATMIITRNEDPFRTVLNFEILAEAQRNPEIAAILQRHDERMRNQFASVLGRAGIDSPQRRTELIFTIFSGLPARALRHPEQEHAALIEMIGGVLLNILGDEGDCPVADL